MIGIRDKDKRIARIKWLLKYLNDHASDLNANDLEWGIKMEESFKDKGDLSFRELGIIESIYKRC